MKWPTIESAIASPDWLTVVTSGEVDNRKARTIATLYFAGAGRVLAWSLMRYKGSISGDLMGVGGGLAYGVNLGLESAILQSWGEVCYKVGRAVLDGTSGRVSRCDLAVTVLFESPLPAIRDWPIGGDLKARPDVTLVVPGGSEGGTLYVGHRGSDAFGRVYDKGAELGTIPPCLYWRWEVEYKRQPAQTLAHEVWALEDAESRASYIARQVADWFTKRDIITPPWSTERLCYPVVRYSTRIRSDQTTLTWLRQQVRPAVMRLHEHGHRDEIMRSLGVGNPLEFVLEGADADEPDSRQSDFLAALQG
jgi:hypothetical protein